MPGPRLTAENALNRQWTAGRVASLACQLEVAAPKPGNVHRGADFEDVSLTDFLTSSLILGQAIDQGQEQSTGSVILDAVQQTRQWVGSNTNLGLVLLLVPLAKAAETGSPIDLQPSLQNVLARLNPADSEAVYAAIRTSQAGGLDEVPEGDLYQPAPESLLTAMQLASERDLVARQYANGFREVFQCVVPSLRTAVEQWPTLPEAIVQAHLEQMANSPDSLIARKCGSELAVESARRAADVLGLLGSRSPASLNAYWAAVSDLDFWLRSDGHRRNPGTTADLIGAGLFVCLWSGHLRPPFSTLPQWTSSAEPTHE